MDTTLSEFEQAKRRALQKMVLSGNGMALMLHGILSNEGKPPDIFTAIRAWEYSLEEMRDAMQN